MNSTGPNNLIDLAKERIRRKWRHFECLACHHEFTRTERPEDCPECHAVGLVVVAE